MTNRYCNECGENLDNRCKYCHPKESQKETLLSLKSEKDSIERLLIALSVDRVVERGVLVERKEEIEKALEGTPDIQVECIKYCSLCDGELEDDWSFCPFCGDSV